MRLFISMIPPNLGGAGDYLTEIIKDYPNHTVICPFKPRLKNVYLRKIIVEAQIIFLKIVLKMVSKFKIDNLVIYHPQTISFSLSNSLILASKKVNYIVLDASIFCLKSYNHRLSNVCEKCIELFDPHDDCSFFPRKSSKVAYLNHRNILSANTNKIHFVVQTEGYVNILKKMFNNNVSVSIKKMFFSQLKQIKFIEREKKYDFAFHGNLLDAKGFKYVRALALNLNDKSFFIPGKHDNYQNICYQNVNWNNGLKNILESSKIILCPSLWSASLEAAILKTMLLNLPVAITVNDFSASNTLIPRDCFINLTGNISKDKLILTSILHDKDKQQIMIEKAYSWAINYIK